LACFIIGQDAHVAAYDARRIYSGRRVARQELPSDGPVQRLVEDPVKVEDGSVWVEMPDALPPVGIIPERRRRGRR